MKKKKKRTTMRTKSLCPAYTQGTYNKAKLSRRLIIAGIIALAVSAITLSSCNPQADWAKENVEVQMTVGTVSAGFIECDFSTNKDAYYLIACHEPWEDFDPMSNQKAFMQLALDSAYAHYLLWRNNLLRRKQTNVAPFSSHSLQYGNMHHFFTGLWFNTNYWVYAFAVNPETMTPIGKLQLVTTNTKPSTIFKNIRFEYRIDGLWDYIYPIDSTGYITTHFPYIATIIDSVALRDSINHLDNPERYSPWNYFLREFKEAFAKNSTSNVRYGVNVYENIGIESVLAFEDGHTYYTCISGFDGGVNQIAIYKFNWTKNYKHYFCDTDSTNIYRKYNETNHMDSWNE